ncbi:MAG: glycosyltransferase family 2 protein [Treponema sp.]
MENPKISIIVPVYNVEKYIRRCLDSIAAQTFTDWECICVDDGTPDASGKICDEYAQKDSRFVVIHKENGGVSSARNVGLDAAKGEWICFVDSDDWVEKEMLEVLYKASIENNAEVVVSGLRITDKHGNYQEFLPSAGWLSMPRDFQSYFNAPWGKLYRKTIILENKIYFPEGITLAEDLYFVFNVFFTSQKIFGIDKSFYNYYKNSSSCTHTMTIRKIEDFNCVLERIEQILISSNADTEWFNFFKERRCEVKNYYCFSFKQPHFEEWRNYHPELYVDLINHAKPLTALYYFCIQHRYDRIASFMFKIKNRKIFHGDTK